MLSNTLSFECWPDVNECYKAMNKTTITTRTTISPIRTYVCFLSTKEKESEWLALHGQVLKVVTAGVS